MVAEPGVPDCINTTMKRVEAMGANAAVGSSLGDAGVAELFNRNDPMLASSKTGNKGVRIGFVAFAPHSGAKATTPPISPPLHCRCSSR
jgi:hypothetical protein